MYEIPNNVKDLDDLANAWSLSPAEFNAIKGIYGASRTRQGLTARHKASEDDPVRDLLKAIHYTNKMLEFHKINLEKKQSSMIVGSGVKGDL
jgi:hypothetical protein